MNVDRVRRICLALPHAEESVKWGDNLVFTIDAKMFAVAALEPGPIWVSFKCSPEDYAELIDRPEIRPAPYLARAHWVALETRGALPASELDLRLEEAYRLVLAKLPKKRRLELTADPK